MTFQVAYDPKFERSVSDGGHTCGPTISGKAEKYSFKHGHDEINFTGNKVISIGIMLSSMYGNSVT